jgi:POT family proton-dependent oligopeptide transporter
MHFFGHVMPTSWLITIDATLGLTCIAGSMAFWRLWARRLPQPNEVTKIAIGMIISMLGLLMMVIGASLGADGRRISVFWPLAFDLLNSLGYANVFPVGLALYARASPKSLVATVIGIYYCHLFVASNLAGWLGGLMERLTGVQFWLLHVGIEAAGAAMFIVLGWVFIRVLAPVDDRVAAT